MSTAKHLVWIDLEMTGLDHQHDLILEIAVLITDFELNIVAMGPEIVIHAPSSKLDNMHELVRNMHIKSGLIDKVINSQVTQVQAQDQVLAFISQYGAPGTMPLCGNSIWQDKLFLITHMPKLIYFLHYRIIDVSTIKELVTGWYGVPEFKKHKTHRALLDIQESISELKYYRKHYFI
jgi:oligoribonuclease